MSEKSWWGKSVYKHRYSPCTLPGGRLRLFHFSSSLRKFCSCFSSFACLSLPAVEDTPLYQVVSVWTYYPLPPSGGGGGVRNFSSVIFSQSIQVDERRKQALGMREHGRSYYIWGKHNIWLGQNTSQFLKTTLKARNLCYSSLVRRGGNAMVQRGRMLKS